MRGLYLEANKADIRVQPWRNRKILLIIEGLKEEKEGSLQKFLQKLKKEFCCGGSIQVDKQNDERQVIQLNGDNKAACHLLLRKMFPDANIVVHGG